MSGHVPQHEGEEPERPESGEVPEEMAAGGPASHAGDAEDDDLDTTRLPSVLRESAWSRMDEREALDHWVPPPPYLSHAEAGRARRRVVAGGLAVVVVAAAMGGVAGALLVGGPSRDAGEPGASEAVEALRSSIGQLAFEVRSLKQGLGEDSQTTAAGLAAIEQRIAGAETLQADLSERIAGLAETRATPPPPGPGVSAEVTGSIAPAPVPVAEDWILWRVRNGRALVQGAPGYFEVETGSDLPGLGIIQRIVKEDGRWMVYTPRAVIVSRG